MQEVEIKISAVRREGAYCEYRDEVIVTFRSEGDGVVTIDLPSKVSFANVKLEDLKRAVAVMESATSP